MDIFFWIPIIMRLIDWAPKIQAALSKNQNIVQLIESLAPDLLPLFKEIGSKLFPNLDTSGQVQVAALTFDPERVRWIQSSINKLTDAKLVVDGHYGIATKAAVVKFQQAHDLNDDGWAGKNTSAVIETELTKLSD